VLQIACTVVDYKFSLHGLPGDSEEYLRKLNEVFLCVCVCVNLVIALVFFYLICVCY
jgi:hypothetical protein